MATDHVIIYCPPGRLPVAITPDLTWHVVESDDNGEYLGREVSGPDEPTVTVQTAEDRA